MSHFRMIAGTLHGIPALTRNHDAFNIDELKALASDLETCRGEILAEIERRRRFKVVRDAPRHSTPGDAA